MSLPGVKVISPSGGCPGDSMAGWPLDLIAQSVAFRFVSLGRLQQVSLASQRSSW